MTEPVFFEPAALPEDAVEVGRVVGAWGVKGWIKVQPYSSSPEALLAGKTWFLAPPDKGARPFETPVRLQLRQSRVHSDAVVAWIHGIDDRDAAESLRGARVFVSRASFPATQDDEYYWVDLIGLDVVNREGVALGVVRDLLATGPQTTLVLSWDDAGKARERLIPFVAAFVDQVDLQARRITVDWQPDF